MTYHLSTFFKAMFWIVYHHTVLVLILKHKEFYRSIEFLENNTHFARQSYTFSVFISKISVIAVSCVCVCAPTSLLRNESRAVGTKPCGLYACNFLFDFHS